MSPIYVSLLVILAVILGVALLMDLKRRHLHDNKCSGAMARGGRQLRMQGREKGSEWGAGM